MCSFGAHLVNLLEHLRRFEDSRIVKCEEYDKTFEWKLKLKSHKRVRREDSCNECGETIKTGNLARHKKTIHSQGIKSRVEEEFKCDQCPYVTKNNFMDTRSMLKDLLCIRENNIKVLSTSIVLILEISSKINIL